MIVTLGLEEELQVVDVRTGALVPQDIDRVRKQVELGSGGVAGEIHKCTVELQTPIESHPDDIVLSLSRLRDVARAQTALQGRHVLAAGLHPYSSWQGQPVHEDAAQYPHYAHLLHEYGEIARSAMSFGMHVHLGLPDASLRIPVMNALRSVLPDVLALSANSPFYEGRDTGLASWRHSVLGRYPRMGIPEIWPDEQAYFDHIDRLRGLGSIEPDQGMWDDLRLHHRYKTLEVRICDAIYSLDRIWLIVALLQCEAMTLVEEARAGSLAEPEAKVWIEENKWRARRYGLAAEMVDGRRSETVSPSDRYGRWLDRLRPAAASLGIWPKLELATRHAIAEGTCADRQRLWRRDTGSFEGLVKALAEATAEPLLVSPSIGRARGDIHEIPEAELGVSQSWSAAPSDLRARRASAGAARRPTRRLGTAAQ